MPYLRSIDALLRVRDHWEESPQPLSSHCTKNDVLDDIWLHLLKKLLMENFIFVHFYDLLNETYSGPHQTSKMNLSVETLNGCSRSSRLQKVS